MRQLVTVLMPTFNSSKYLDTSISSILNQTYFDFEFLIINDGSTDNTEEVIKSYNDKRIQYVRNFKNMGVAKTLNKGINLSKGDYIVRMDSDDFSINTRIEKQVDFMNKNPKVGLCGSHFLGFGDFTNEYKYPTCYDDIKICLLNKNVIGHPTSIMRKTYFLNNNLYYNYKYQYCEDYELWTRAARCFEIANIPEILFYHRKHIEQISTQYRSIQKQTNFQIQLNQIINIVGNLTIEEKLDYKNAIENGRKTELQSMEKLMNRFLLLNRKYNYYNQDKLQNFIYGNTA